MTTFNDLNLAAPILKALGEAGYVTPTPIQAQAIPALLQGRDLLGIAQTGTGKTAAFSLPMIDRLSKTKGRPAPRTCRALILSPTRELASQIAENIRAYAKHLPLTATVVVGGVSVGPQARVLQQGVDILVATPGRLVDHLGLRNISLSATEFFVLDEADQMLDLGFIHAIRKIVGLLPKVRQNLFFSATMPNAIGQLAGDLLSDPVSVSVTPVATTAERVEQRVIFVGEGEDKKKLLVELFADRSMDRVLAFTRTKHGADKVVKHLEAAGINAAAIHGNKSQPQRERALAGFKNGTTRILVATDIAARGIDVDAVSHVVNVDLPNMPESYVHRIGRTARAGASGIAISFCDIEEREYLKDIEKLIRFTVPTVDIKGEPAERPAPVKGVVPPHKQQQMRGQQRGQQRQSSGGQRDGGRPGGSSGSGRPQEGRGGNPGQPGQRPAAGHHQAAKRPQQNPRPQDARPAHAGPSAPASRPDGEKGGNWRRRRKSRAL